MALVPTGGAQVSAFAIRESASRESKFCPGRSFVSYCISGLLLSNRCAVPSARQCHWSRGCWRDRRADQLGSRFLGRFLERLAALVYLDVYRLVVDDDSNDCCGHRLGGEEAVSTVMVTDHGVCARTSSTFIEKKLAHFALLNSISLKLSN